MRANTATKVLIHGYCVSICTRRHHHYILGRLLHYCWSSCYLYWGCRMLFTSVCGSLQWGLNVF